MLTGLQHKYPQTALLLVTDKCFSHCRFCFRRRMHETTPRFRKWGEIAVDYPKIAAYVRGHPEINNLLFSGGDPLTLSTGRLHRILDHFLPIAHLTLFRFGTKAIVSYPPRFRDKELPSLFEKIRNAGKTPAIVTHVDHIGEVSEETEAQVTNLRTLGVQFFNQTVLLNHVNDDPGVLVATFRKLHSLGVRPYYLFQARPTKHASHFQVPLRRGVEIVRSVNSRLFGLEKTFRYVMSHDTGKVEILDIGSDNRLYMRYHQSGDVEKVGKLFSRVCRDDACWLDDLPLHSERKHSA